MTSGSVLVLDGAALDAALHGAVSDPRRYLLRFGYDPPPLDAVDIVARPLDAEVNGGQWIWLCPCTPDADSNGLRGGGVVFVDTLLGWCPTCANVETGGLWRPLRLPTERAAIEQILSGRPDPEARNWWPGETVGDLERENAEHGLGDPSMGA